VRLRVWFNDGTHGSQLLTPDQRIVAVGYAMMAGNAATVADGAITSAKLADGAVGSAQLANGAVTAANMAAGAVGSAQIANGAIGTSQLAANAVQSANLAAGAVSGEGWSGIAGTTIAARLRHTAVWTGTELIVWGGLVDNHAFLNTGGRYNPVTNAWTVMSTTGAPDARYLHTAVWTGTEMIVWGGYNDNGDMNTGARYNPATDTWTAMSTIGAPAARDSQTAVWTGSEMLIWGGASSTGGPTTYPNEVGRYSPAGNGGAGTWTIIPGTLANTPTGRYNHVAVWTGSEMIVWGGDDGSIWNTGGRYNPAANGGVGSWTAVDTAGAPSARDLPAVVWTGSEMIVWGGGDANGALPDGGRYNPASDSWTAINAATPSRFAPAARYFHTAVWTGSEMIVWGGENEISPYFLTSGGRYNPSGNGGVGSWTELTTTGAPAARAWHTAVWTGGEMVV
jgi:hypothetical protein